MKVNCLAALSLAPLMVLSMPIVLVENLVPATAHHRHQPPAAPVAAKRPAHALPEVILDVEDAAVQISFDNSPVTPTATSTARKILELPRPVATTYLWSLGSSRRKSPPRFKDEWEVVEASSVAQMEMGFVEELRHGRPGSACYYARLSRDHNERLVVFLVLGFLATVITVEAWAAACSCARRTAAGQGAIRLEDEEAVEHQPLSVQAEVEDIEAVSDIEEAVDEKDEVKDEKVTLL